MSAPASSTLPVAAPRLAGKTAIISGAGQAPGLTVGNGRATALLFARAGANPLLCDRDDASDAEKAELPEAAGAKPAGRDDERRVGKRWGSRRKMRRNTQQSKKIE